GIYGTVDMDPGPGVHQEAADNSTGRGFILELSPTGGFVRSVTYGFGAVSVYSFDLDLAVDRAGEVVIVGTFSGTGDFDPGPDDALLTAAGAGHNDGFVLKLDKDGRYLAASRFGSDGDDHALGVAIEPDGAATFVGQCRFPADFGSSFRLTSQDGASVGGFIAQVVPDHERARTGDFDGDGLTDSSVFDPSTSTFYLARSTAGNVAAQFGKG